MNERKGWIMFCIGSALIVLACLGLSVVVFLWTSALVEGIVG